MVSKGTSSTTLPASHLGPQANSQRVGHGHVPLAWAVSVSETDRVREMDTEREMGLMSKCVLQNPMHQI